MFGEGVEVCSYDDLAHHAVGYDALVHLAVLNNDQDGSLDDFRAVNLTLLETVLEAVRQAGVPLIINTSTLKAVGGGTTPYAVSKTEAEALLRSQDDVRVVNLRLAAVYGEQFKGTLRILEKVPELLRPAALHVLACAKPVTHVSLIPKSILDHVGDGSNAAGFTEEFVTDGQHHNPVYRTVMRGIDLLAAVAIIGLFWWLLLLVWIGIRLGSTGPGIFAQTRVGRRGRTFTCYKFRTMKLGTAERGTHEISASNVTKFGTILRKTKIDELPQAANILLNHLSLVGPRPCLPSQTHLIDERDARDVFRVKSGITGWAQINSIDMSQPERLAKADAEYIARRTVLFDLSIMVRTFLGAGHGDRTSR